MPYTSNQVQNPMGSEFPCATMWKDTEHEWAGRHENHTDVKEGTF